MEVRRRKVTTIAMYSYRTTGLQNERTVACDLVLSHVTPNKWYHIPKKILFNTNVTS
jgi:hypothetical protein